MTDPTNLDALVAKEARHWQECELTPAGWEPVSPSHATDAALAGLHERIGLAVKAAVLCGSTAHEAYRGLMRALARKFPRLFHAYSKWLAMQVKEVES